MRALFVGLGSIGTRHLKNLCGRCASRGIPLQVDALRSSTRPLPPQTAARYLRIEYYTRFVFLGIVLVSWLSPTLSDILFWPLEFLRSGILNLYQALMLLLF